MNIKTAKSLKQGQIVYHTVKRNADGTPMRAKVTSVKTWKKDLTRVEIGLKHGLYDYAKYNENDILYIEVKESIAKRRYFVTKDSLPGSCSILDKKTGKDRNYIESEFVYGQRGYNEDTEKYPQYVHLDVYRLCNV